MYQYYKNKEGNKKKAKAHIKEMDEKYQKEIRKSREKTHIYGPDAVRAAANTSRTEFRLVDMDSVSAVFCAVKDFPGKTVCVVNFASYKNPGGKYLEGSSAQEESLCMESDLYNILTGFKDSYYEWNRKHLNKGLYLDRALYTPAVVFQRDGREAKADVLTCAAPNHSLGLRYRSFSEEENSEALSSRIAFIRDICRKEQADILIFGAFGCGVFRQDPAEAAEITKEVFTESSLEKVILAVPRLKDHDANYEAFHKVF